MLIDNGAHVKEPGLVKPGPGLVEPRLKHSVAAYRSNHMAFIL